MAVKRKTEAPVKPLEPIETPQIIEVELSDTHKGITSVISNGIIEFTDGKAQVHTDTAESLRTQGFIN